ncbi:hypothetical protein SNE40_020159 [Patella caerulea]|uniref:Uncharacterized protein n=1 Tax=Patella caerulea TaxID=87958 RepID=A0AAN8GHK3_PATCE
MPKLAAVMEIKDYVTREKDWGKKSACCENKTDAFRRDPCKRQEDFNVDNDDTEQELRDSDLTCNPQIDYTSDENNSKVRAVSRH